MENSQVQTRRQNRSVFVSEYGHCYQYWQQCRKALLSLCPYFKQSCLKEWNTYASEHTEFVETHKLFPVYLWAFICVVLCAILLLAVILVFMSSVLGNPATEYCIPAAVSVCVLWFSTLQRLGYIAGSVISKTCITCHSTNMISTITFWPFALAWF